MPVKPVKEFETPVKKAKFAIREWIGGAEAEYIEAPILNSVEERRADARARIAAGTPKQEGIPEQAIHVSNHRAIEVYVASVQLAGGERIEDPKKVLHAVLHELPSNDYAFMLDKIRESEAEAKKKCEASST